ncbi:MAG: hydrogenase small subunit [Planctomycetes bacterium]|nr:hydrogenase small subunit [Planctomycetota bacterium]
MESVTRRDLLKLAGILAAGVALPGKSVELFAAGLEKLTSTQRVLWLQGQSCSGCSVSLLNTMNPGPVSLLTQFISLVAHQNVGAAQGKKFMDVLDLCERTGDFILVLEGSIPMGMPEACVIGGRTYEEILLKMIPRAKAVAAVGTCAAFGGIPKAEGNPTGAACVKEFMTARGLPYENKLLNCPSCPAHPKSMVGTLAYVAQKGYPEVVPELLTPKMFYGKSTHDDCPRYHYYERKIFSKFLGDPEGCLFMLGCLGPISYTSCPHRQWNSGVNWCIRAAAPCIGCSSPHFARRKDLPFYRKGENLQAVTCPAQDQGGNKV